MSYVKLVDHYLYKEIRTSRNSTKNCPPAFASTDGMFICASHWQGSRVPGPVQHEHSAAHAHGAGVQRYTAVGA